MKYATFFKYKFYFQQATQAYGNGNQSKAPLDFSILEDINNDIENKVIHY